MKGALKSAKIIITNDDRTKKAEILFQYPTYATRGTYQITGDPDLVGLFNAEAKNDHLLYLPYTPPGEVSETFDFVTVCARIVALRFGGEIAFEGKAKYPRIKFDPNVIY